MTTNTPTPLSDATIYHHERRLLKMFLMTLLTEQHAISDRMGVLTWANDHDTQGIESGLCMIYADYRTGVRNVQRLAPIHVGYEELIDAAVDSLLTRNEGDFSNIIVHETVQSDSSGISWKWIRKHTMVPATICTRNPIARYIQRQEQRTAEAELANDWDSEDESPETEDTLHDDTVD